MIKPEHYVYWTIGAALLSGLCLYALLEGFRSIYLKLTGKGPRAGEWREGLRPADQTLPGGRVWRAIPDEDWRIKTWVPLEPASVSGVHPVGSEWYRDENGALKAADVPVRKTRRAKIG